jgi:hypothetical protein
LYKVAELRRMTEWREGEREREATLKIQTSNFQTSERNSFVILIKDKRGREQREWKIGFSLTVSLCCSS